MCLFLFICVCSAIFYIAFSKVEIYRMLRAVRALIALVSGEYINRYETSVGIKEASFGPMVF